MNTLTAGKSVPASGQISGFVLRLARQSAGLTQEQLADVLGVDISTIQGWESGRRPLSAISAGDFLRLCGRLSRLGAPASTGRHLREAIEADQVLATGIAAGHAWANPDSHPLAASVHRWTITNLILWPILEKTPQHLSEFTPRTARRGPMPTHPTLSTEERTRFLDHLLTVAERARHADEALLRRQAVSCSVSMAGRRRSNGCGPNGNGRADVARKMETSRNSWRPAPHRLPWQWPATVPTSMTSSAV
jgi:transcriptional regulator with XRE-family HTH domain